jgi:phosphoribosylanthranilate isomerase
MIKVCGVTTEADARFAIEAGVDALGFNFYAKSPRYLSPGAAGWVRGLATLKVGVFVDETVAAVREISERVGLDVVQIHRGSVPAGMRYWQAVSIDEAPAYAGDAEAVVVDAPPLTQEMPGGTGKSYDWRRAFGLPGKILLAGGLDGANVAEAIRQARPWGVDAASRLESAPGVKDPRKVEAFIKAAREMQA